MRITKQEATLMRALIDMASVEFDGVRARVEKEILENGRYEFLSVLNQNDFEMFYLVAQGVLEGEEKYISLMALSTRSPGFCEEVSRHGEGVSSGFLSLLFDDLKLQMFRARWRSIFLELCEMVEATRERAEFIEERIKYLVEFEIRDSELHLYAKQVVGDKTFLIAEFKTTEPLDKGLQGLGDEIIAFYKVPEDTHPILFKLRERSYYEQGATKWRFAGTEIKEKEEKVPAN